MARTMLRSALPLLVALAATPAGAQVLRPPGMVEDAGPVVRVQMDAGSLLARIQTLEGQNRVLTGQVQDMQNQLRRIQDDFKRYREDTEYRLQAIEGGGGKPAPAKPQRRTEVAPDAGQPEQQPGLGAPPRQLGSLPADANQQAAGNPPLDLDQPDMGAPPADPNAPMDLGQPAAPVQTQPRMQSSLTPPGLPGVAVDTNVPPAGVPQQQQQAPLQTASLPAGPEAEYTADYRLIESGSYEAAEMAFRKFLSAYPKDRRVPDAIHWIGESLYQRKQYRDAAEQFLKVTTTYASYRRAPSSMLKLGMSLAALGEKEAACATFQEVGRKYPNAPAVVKSGAEREVKKNAC